MQSVDEALKKLNKSKFRSRFHLSEKDIEYYKKRGEDGIRADTYEFIKKRLAPKFIPNDGRQTPMRGHPVFIAQHACACCCRGCLNKWYNVKKDIALNDVQTDKIVNLLMTWIKKEVRGQTT